MSQDKQTVKFRPFQAIDPQGKILATFDFESDEQILQRIERGHQYYTNSFRDLSFQQRKQKLLKLAQVMEKYVEEDAKLISLEIGKPYPQALMEVKKSIEHCRYYADNLEQLLKPQESQVLGGRQQVIHEPLGVVYIITPFNFPHWQVFKPAIANLALGNTLLVRIADSCPLTGKNIQARFDEAGFGDAYQNVFTTPAQLELIMKNPNVHACSFTGSSGAGKAIASIAGKYLKKVVLELGGSDPFIVLEDADLELATNLAVKARLLNCGQVCIASKRFLIHEKVFDKFVKLLIFKVKQLKIGYPLEEGVFLGPMARLDLLEGIEQQVQKSQQQGGKLLYGGQRLTERPGNFYVPAILEVQDEQNIILQEETFGPIFALKKIKNGQEGVQIANSSEFGLGSVVIGRNIDNATKIGRQLQSGMTFINEMSKSDSRFPVGGMKQSGYGRECGEFGIKEFSNVKLMWVVERPRL